MQRVLTTVTLLGLLVATAAAFAITEHLKLEKSPVSIGQISSVLSPVCDCPTAKAHVRFKLRQTGRVTVVIVDADGHKVATIAPNVLARAHSPQHFPWDGRTEAGHRAPDGVYYPWIQLPHRTFQLNNKIVLDTVPPQVLSPPQALKPVLLAGPGRSVAIRYGFSEKAHALVYLDGQRIIVGRKTAPQAKIKWNGKLDGEPVRAGRHVLEIGAQDLAGNETPAAKRKTVTVDVRYFELSPERITVGSHGRIRVHVKTTERRYKWRLGQRHGERRGRVLRLRAPSTPGTYRLVVGEGGQSATAVVRVHK